MATLSEHGNFPQIPAMGGVSIKKKKKIIFFLVKISSCLVSFPRLQLGNCIFSCPCCLPHLLRFPFVHIIRRHRHHGKSDYEESSLQRISSVGGKIEKRLSNE